MRSPYFLITLLGALGALGASQCIGPIAPGLTTCGTCGDVRGTQCVSNGQWFSCFKSYEDCCSDWSIKNHQSNAAQCVKDSQALAAAPTEAPLTDKLPKLKHSECAEYVSRDQKQDNAFCMTSCDAVLDAGKKLADNADFNAQCLHQHWTAVNGRTKVDDQCFEKWIYGYSQENNLSSFIQGLITDTPAQCMYLCQITEECVNWAWLSELYASTGSEQVGRCMLKNKVMVEMAATIRTDSDPSPNMDTDYCNYGMPHQCMYGGYVCLPCNGGEKRCVWESDMHVSGWKTCVHTDMCAPHPSPSLEPSFSPAEAITASPTPKADENKSSPTAKADENKSSATPKADENKSSPTPKADENKSSPTPKADENKSSPTPKADENESSPSAAPSASPEGAATTTVIPTAQPQWVSTSGSKANSSGKEEYPPPKPQNPSAKPEESSTGLVLDGSHPHDYEQTQPVNPSSPLAPQKSTAPAEGPVGTGDEHECEQKPTENECSEKPSDGHCEAEKPTCREDCPCRGEPVCGCCAMAKRAQLLIRVADRPKKLHFDLEN